MIGITLSTGARTDVAVSFHFLKEDLRFFLKSLPFDLPELPCEPHFDGNAYYHLKEFPAGMVSEDVQRNFTENRRSPAPGASPCHCNIGWRVLRDLFGMPVNFSGEAILSYGVLGTNFCAVEKWDQYSKKFNEALTHFKREILRYIEEMAEWEWIVFCKASDASEKCTGPSGLLLMEYRRRHGRRTTETDFHSIPVVEEIPRRAKFYASCCLRTRFEGFGAWTKLEQKGHVTT